MLRHKINKAIHTSYSTMPDPSAQSAGTDPMIVPPEQPASLITVEDIFKSSELFEHLATSAECCLLFSAFTCKDPVELCSSPITLPIMDVFCLANDDCTCSSEHSDRSP